MDARLAIVLFTAALTAFSPPAFPQPANREQAVSELSSADAATRAQAVVWLANRGSMADAPLLHERLRDESAFVRSYAERGLWLLWGRSGDAEVDRLMARGSDEQQSGRLDEAISTYSEVIARKPEFAEGWNRRATAYYLAGDFNRSIADCDEVLKRNPGHFGALAGLGQIYLQLQQPSEARKWLRRALEANPNMLGVEFQLRILEERTKNQT
ncbi:MAG TPA: tetratricopeptide repeat protein [Burkholderiales bacterium]|nr:tetratricopeptide repeat protein [Burkholderiales bacterium]